MARKPALLLLLTICLLPFVYFGAAGAAYLYRNRVGNERARRFSDRLMPAVTSASRILVFSPHPDDEALGCAGLIRKAVSAGAAVHVVILTNGDGFRVATERQYRRIDVGPRDYIAFGRVRQDEARAAMRALGLSSSDVTFLGYPDGGLMALWESSWSEEHPWTSRYTKLKRVGGGDAYRPGATYCGQNLLADVRRIIDETRPTDVFVTHPSDDHSDHAAASAFVTLACNRPLDEASSESVYWNSVCSDRATSNPPPSPIPTREGEPEAAIRSPLPVSGRGRGRGSQASSERPKLYYYLVHRGDWPQPRGLSRSRPLYPPIEMQGIGTEWSKLALDPDEQSRKLRCLRAYRSQMAMMRTFLLSFARGNELFGVVTAPTVAHREMPPAPRLPSDAGRWTGARPALLDPVNDNLLRDFQGGGDVEAVYALRDAGDLYLRVETYQPIARGVEFRINVRYFGDPATGQTGGMLSLRVRPPARALPSDLLFACSDRSVDVTIPMRDVRYARSLAVNVETRVAGLEIDTTGYRFLRL